MKEREIKQKLEEGYLRVSTIFEIIGQPKQHVEDTIKAYVTNIKQEQDIVFLQEEYDDASEVEEGLFSAIAEVEMLMPNIEKLTWLCINFSPASVEIIAPDKLTITDNEVTHWLNDLLSKLHEIGVVQKTTQSQNQGLVRNFNAMTRNAILLALKETQEIEGISKRIGMDKEHATKFLEALEKEEKVRKEGNKYHLNN